MAGEDRPPEPPECKWRGAEGTVVRGRFPCTSPRGVIGRMGLTTWGEIQGPIGVSPFDCLKCPYPNLDADLKIEALVRASLANQSAAPDPPAAGPGTELKKLLAEIGAEDSPTCPCNARAAEMDRWGVEGCAERREEIVAWLKEAWKSLGWGERVRLAARAAWEGHASLSDPWGAMVDKAIERAKQT